MFQRVFFACAALLFSSITLITCGGNTSGPADNVGVGGTLAGVGGAGGGTGGGTGGTGSGCQAAGSTCAVPTDCCTLVCDNGTCGGAPCTSEGQPCSTGSQCCSANCSAGACAPLNPSCRTAGNSCSTNAECCSKLCTNGSCDGRVSFCTQLGDACARDLDCCGGLCNKAAGATLGICAVAPTSGVPGCLAAGQVCGGATTGVGGVPICGGECCSRSCRPYGPTGILVCQPPSGCRPTGELCQSDNDCCGAPGAPGSTNVSGGQMTNVHCSKAAGAAVGRCDNGNACSPAGAICRLAITSCNATDRCCAGTVQTHPLNCKQDLLGIPRCTAESDRDCTAGAPPPGTPCASSADCCNKPCVPNPAGAPPFICGGGECVPTEGACTTTADCCVGTSCNIPPGASTGSCGPPPPPVSTPDGGTVDAGVTCAQYGQTCTQNSDCCTGVPCTNGRCIIIVN